MNGLPDINKYQSFSPAIRANSDAPKPDLNIGAHYSDNMKLPRPNPRIAEVPVTLPSKSTFQTLNNEANERLKKINTDIYQGTKKERAKHEFDTALYFKIFIGILLAVTGITCFHKIRNFFKKS